jgi:hypothetical protein
LESKYYVTEEPPFFRCKFMWPVPEEPFSFTNQFQRTILTSWINVFLICVLIGLYLSSKGDSPESFVFNYLVEFPLWFMCNYALKEMEIYIGRRPSDLLHIFTNNTVQVISSVSSSHHGQDMKGNPIHVRGQEKKIDGIED